MKKYKTILMGFGHQDLQIKIITINSRHRNNKTALEIQNRCLLLSCLTEDQKSFNQKQLKIKM